MRTAAAVLALALTGGLAESGTGQTLPPPVGLYSRTPLGATPADSLEIRLVGNAGVVLSDGVTSLLVDLPYEPGAFGYDRYDPAGLDPAGKVVSVITHDHRDHFAPGLFLPHPAWRVIGPPSAVAGVPPGRVIPGDSVAIGAFQAIAIPTPHTDDHRSWRIRWRGRVLHFTGDTEDPTALLAGPRLDVLFLTPWLACALADAGRPAPAARAILYHRNPDGSDRHCGSTESLPQGTRLHLAPG